MRGVGNDPVQIKNKGFNLACHTEVKVNTTRRFGSGFLLSYGSIIPLLRILVVTI